MSKIDYEKIGFKAGLEIHQQLNTGKLFCSCPGVLRSDRALFEVKRKLHLVKGESGEVDVAAKYQHMEDKEFIYEAYDTTCLVELDEEPPHEINKDALFVALQISELLHCKIIPITQVMRKTVIDGSNTSGFQRSLMYARDGYIETSLGKVRIDSLYLEEDSARPIERNEKFTRYRLDRLGIPLVEITTKPDLKNAAHVKEAALIIGDILRSCNVRRGIGTIRQDLNISIKGANRVEIKGFQDPKIMEETVNLEISRQQMYLELKDLKFKENKTVDVTNIISPKLDWMKKQIDSGAKFIAFKLNGFNGKLGKVDGKPYWLGKEIAGLCKTRGFGGIIHSDEDLEKYKFDNDEIEKLKEVLDMKKDDAFLMLLGKKEKIESLLRELVFLFLSKLKFGNPSEVRNCLVDGTTEFSRPMPGSARMYPETDLELLHIHRDLINEVKKNLPKLRSELEEDLKKQALREDQIKILVNDLDLFKLYSSLHRDYNNSMLIANMLIDYPKDFSSRYNMDLEKIYSILNEDVLAFILEKVNSKEVEVVDVKGILEKIVKGEDLENAVKVEKLDLGEIEGFVVKLLKEKPGLRPNAYMGLVMKEFGGKVQPSEVMGIITKLI